MGKPAFRETNVKALFCRSHGDISQVEYGELPPPTRSSHETLLKVEAASLNHLDIWVRRGWKGLSIPLPHIFGSDIVGHVVESSDPIRWSPGSRVVVCPGYLAQPSWDRSELDCLSPLYRIIGEHRDGGCAEYISVPTSSLYQAPDNLPAEHLAAFLLTGTTVWRMLFSRAQLKVGSTLLVVGSGGGVNGLSILVAALNGCSVIALAGSDEKGEVAQKLGAEKVISYRSHPDWHREVLAYTDGQGVDVVVDNVGAHTFDSSIKSLRSGGVLVTVGNTSGAAIAIDNRRIFAKQLSIVGSTMGTFDDFEKATTFLWGLPKETLQVLLDTVAPLSDGKAMMQRLEAGRHCGKIVLVP